MSCQPSQDLMRISIADTGVGIAAQDMEMLFEPFNRLGAENSSIEGTGVGLALTRKLARLMNTDIFVQSTVGEGSIFYFDLPLLPAGSLDISTTTAVAVQEDIPKKYQVLYIEDNLASQRLMAELCEEIAEVQLSCVSSAEEGFEIACSQLPHLILLDVDLPGMNGLQAGRMLKHNSLTQHIPLLVVSASCAAEDKQLANTLGFAGFYSKPFNLNMLTEHIQQLLSPAERV